MFFDTHVHFFPDFLAKKALEHLVDICSLETHSDGTYEGTLDVLRSWNSLGAVALHIATNPHQQESVNNFAIETNKGAMLCFGSVHPDSENALSELERIKDAGLHGIKLHPDYQNFYADDERVYEIYGKAEALELPIAFHTGRDPLSPEDIHCTPQRLSNVAKYFPKLRIIAAHMGGSYMPEDSIRYLSGLKNVWIDTGVISEFLSPAEFSELVNAFGAERVFYATDCPWASMPKIYEIIENSNINKDEKVRIYYENALDFFGLNIQSLPSL